MCSVPYRKTNYGETLAQEMVVQSHPCGGLSSYMKSEFRSTELQDSGILLELNSVIYLYRKRRGLSHSRESTYLPARG